MLALGLVTVVSTITGISGVGDAPDPHDPAAAMAAHFLQYRDSVLSAAPFGYASAILTVILALVVASRMRATSKTAATLVTFGGGGVAAYLTYLQVSYTSLAYQVAGTSAEATKAIFVPTIMATPVMGVATAVLLAGAAAAAWRRTAIARWAFTPLALLAFISAVSIFSRGNTGFLYADVQQQSTLYAFLLGVLVLTAGARRVVPSWPHI
jgi:hypothetical protein